MKRGETSPASYYLVDDDFILWPGVLVEVEWPTFHLGGLHAIELSDGRVIFRYVRRVTSACGERVLEIHGSNAAERALLPLRLVRRIGTARRFFYVKSEGAREKASAAPANVIQMDAWLDSHPCPIRNLLFAEKGGAA